MKNYFTKITFNAMLVVTLTVSPTVRGACLFKSNVASVTYTLPINLGDLSSPIIPGDYNTYKISGKTVGDIWEYYDKNGNWSPLRAEVLPDLPGKLNNTSLNITLVDENDKIVADPSTSGIGQSLPNSILQEGFWYPRVSINKLKVLDSTTTLTVGNNKDIRIFDDRVCNDMNHLRGKIRLRTHSVLTIEKKSGPWPITPIGFTASFNYVWEGRRHEFMSVRAKPINIQLDNIPVGSVASRSVTVSLWSNTSGVMKYAFEYRKGNTVGDEIVRVDNQPIVNTRVLFETPISGTGLNGERLEKNHTISVESKKVGKISGQLFIFAEFI